MSTMDDDSLIGDFDFLNNKQNVNVENLLKYGRREYIELDYKPTDLIVFPNKKILIVNCEERFLRTGVSTKCFKLYNQNFNLFNKIDRINGEIIRSIGNDLYSISSIHVELFA